MTPDLHPNLSLSAQTKQPERLKKNRQHPYPPSSAISLSRRGRRKANFDFFLLFSFPYFEKEGLDAGVLRMMKIFCVCRGGGIFLSRRKLILSFYFKGIFFLVAGRGRRGYQIRKITPCMCVCVCVCVQVLCMGPTKFNTDLTWPKHPQFSTSSLRDRLWRLFISLQLIFQRASSRATFLPSFFFFFNNFIFIFSYSLPLAYPPLLFPPLSPSHAPWVPIWGDGEGGCLFVSGEGILTLNLKLKDEITKKNLYRGAGGGPAHRKEKKCLLFFFFLFIL